MNRPTASLTGQDDWEWNEQRKRDARGRTASETDDGARGADRSPREHDREAAPEREIRELEAELERAERRFECVVERYERLLEEKNRKLSELRGDEGGATATDGSLSAVLWWRDG
jgi:hypothetical protein